MLITQKDIDFSVSLALQEDINSGDITSQLIAKDATAKAEIITRQDMVLCGKLWLDSVFHQLNPDTKINWWFKDGDFITANQIICEITGNSRNILSGERVALNFLQTLSATATKTHQYCKLLKNAQLLDTRKTIPNLRLAQKYAVTIGGGKNHRIGLHDAYLIKENHILACGSIKNAVETARKLNFSKKIEVEVETLDQFYEALATNCEQIMLDNFSLEDIKIAVKTNNQKCKLEVSGNIDLLNIADYAQTGVDYISVGAITKNIQAIDLSLRLVG